METKVLVEGTYFKNKKKKLHFLDLKDLDSIRGVMRNLKPDIIIHAGGLTNTDYCEKNPERALLINVKGTKNLLYEFQGKMIYFSTDYVFDGVTGNYDEDSTPNPINHYGITKELAEQAVLKQDGNLVVRISGLYGHNPDNNRFIDNFNQNSITAFDNLISSPTYIPDIGNAINKLKNLNGIIHFTGPESFSRYVFTINIINGLGLANKVIPLNYDYSQTFAKRPFNSSLSTKYQHFNPTCLFDALSEMRQLK